jgi:hypothetical protein
MVIEGVYKFILNGEVVHEEKNALTSMGRAIAIKSLLGIVPNFGGVISYGIGDESNSIDSSTNLITNNGLQFEIGRTPVVGSSLELSNSTDVLVYRGIIESTANYQIYEVGLFPGGISSTNADVAGSTIFDFDRVDLFTKVGSASAGALVEAVEARIGTDMFSLPDTDGSNSYISYQTNNNVLEEINRYTSFDTFRLAGFDFNLFSSSVYFRFYTDETNYFDYTFTTPAASGYFIVSTEKGSAVITGSPRWDSITSARIWQTSGSALYLDGFKIDFGSYLQDTIAGMISRAVLTSPVRKPPGIPLTIEYSLSIGFNQIGS